MVIGLNHRTAPLPMRERFWIGENRRYEVLRQLKSAEQRAGRPQGGTFDAALRV